MNMDVNLESGVLCRKTISSRSKYSGYVERKCHRLAHHSGKCGEFPFLEHLKSTHPRVASKIVRDAVMTTGAAWKSAEAGPNRILRWVMLLSDEELLEFGLNMSNLKDQVVAKLREKAADYDSCIRVAMALTLTAYHMRDAPKMPKELRKYFEVIFETIELHETLCCICLLPLSFSLFNDARRGKASIETCHKDPRLHTPDNVGFAHRECNIAQGAKSLEDFYEWISGILGRAKPRTLD